MPDVCAERAFLPDDVARRARGARAAAHLRVGAAGRRLSGSSRSRSPTSWSWPAWSTASTWPGSPRWPRSGRRSRATGPLVVIGGPLTFSNPVPAAPFADVMLAGRRRGDAARADRGAARRAPTAPRCSPAWPRGPASTCRRSTASACPPSPPRRRAPARLLADPDAAHRAARHVPDRGRARLLPRLHLLRDAAVDQRRHAAGRPRQGAVADPRRRAARRPGRRRGHRSPRPARDPARASSTAAARSASPACAPIG